MRMTPPTTLQLLQRLRSGGGAVRAVGSNWPRRRNEHVRIRERQSDRFFDPLGLKIVCDTRLLPWEKKMSQIDDTKEVGNYYFSWVGTASLGYGPNVEPPTIGRTPAGSVPGGGMRPPGLRLGLNPTFGFVDHVWTKVQAQVRLLGYMAPVQANSMSRRRSMRTAL